jgi:hypothetical protein
MNAVKKLLCRHQFEPMAVYSGEKRFVKKCQKCGRRVDEQLSPETATA